MRLIFLLRMKPIQLVDLHTQYSRIKSEIDEAVLDVIESSAYINGPEVKKFQAELEEYLGVKHVIPCANGTDALQIALMAIDAEPGDEIITPSFTYIATAEVIALLGLTPIFVEVDTDNFTLDIEDVRAKITEKTKAIIPVHLYGACADMDAIMEIADEHDLKIIEDTAQAIGTTYRSKSGQTHSAGSIGHIGTTSFFPSKNLGCFGDGGAMMTNDDDLAAKLRMIANHGQRIKYIHDSIGCNSRLDSIQAAVLRVKLKHLDTYTQERNRAANYYSQYLGELEQIQPPQTPENSDHGFHQYTIKLTGVDRDALKEYLNDLGIPANIYYPVPVHLQKGYTKYGFGVGDLPVTEALSEVVLSLPMHTELEKEQQDFIINSIKDFITK